MLHQKAVLTQDFYELGMDKAYNLIGTRRDANGTDYVTFVEHKKYPIFCTMVHYEKVAYQWTDKWYSVDKSLDALRLAQSFSNFFAQECCKNAHKYHSQEQEWSELIENYQPMFVAPKGHIVDSVYNF